MKRRSQLKVLPIAATILALSLATACGNAGSTKDKGSTAPVATADSKEPVKVTLWTPMNPNAKAVVKSLNELPMVKEWAKKTNVTFDFQHSSGNTPQDDIQQYGVMVASNNLPDSMLWSWNSVQGGTSKMFKDGTIIKLNDLIEKNAPNLKKILDANPQIAKQVKSDNGDIYVMPHLKVGQYGQYKTFSGMIIRQDWLEELGLKAPETVDEWETVLKAFKEKKGAIPFTLNKSTAIGGFDFAGAYGVSNAFYIDNGKVKFGPIQPEYKQYLTTMQKWYKEGLIDPDFASNDGKTMDSKVTSGKAGAFYGYIGGSIGTYSPALQKTDPKAKLAPVQYPVLKKGDEPKFVQASWEYDNIGTVITSANKHAAETVKALDYLYSEEGAMLKNFGIEGQTYTKVDGQPKYTDLILKNPDNLPISQAMAKYFIANYGFSGLDDDRYNDQYYQLQSQKDAVKLYAKYANNAYKVLLPPVALTPDEAKESAKIMNDVSTLLSEQVTKVVMGAAKIEDFDKAVEQFKKMNIDRATDIYQAATDRYNKR
ncbi:putative aldouronate transport system substrate-binding protein [Paenibacillus sp. V4I3]|uniref:extracellular solute-binding protein n=1 Tax=unclassified Paenibacillus TaxID=185978 RepID=UPI0027851D68|nr:MULTISPECIES: extracellular solute-binding protein [unclassified Paenibacillus]MDQ0872913.1 putative aldouronate transport system substrate-binding protein [Paenibacillus sp. V4I3]MDQ0891168.1 putative aldouronate transport system substrate-binding protein [Paenibacillus sp. V4I9]